MKGNLTDKLGKICQKILSLLTLYRPNIIRTLTYLADMMGVVACAGFAAVQFSPVGAYIYHNRNPQDYDMVEFVTVGKFEDAVGLALIASVWVLIFGGKK